ncbi:unnamed protein product [Mytilus coruscus]|uniref:Uncharacterized protein n=1 Tax=Mytilus coruscus TaxID=42192 RepID=A0A6J8DUA9_MYTCO|nr:unnamed protein product [Mytilus coruscus]
MKCEIIDLTDNVLPSASGKAYPVNKSGQSLLIWFDDFNYLSLTISKNCVSLALDVFLNTNIDIAYLQYFLTYCPDRTFIQNIFCDFSLAYNVSYIKDVFPHFSNVRIYFYDTFNHCTAQFNVFLESENHLLTNADIYHFLTKKTICWKYVYFTYLLNVKFSLKEISDDENNFKTGSLSTHTSNAVVFVILKHQSCKEQFLHYIYWNGLHVKENDTYILSIDNIITFNQENNCIHVRFSCPDRYNQATIALPYYSAVAYLESAIAVEVTLVNGFMLYIFLQKENRTPVTLLLSALAVSDTTAAILMTIPKCIAYQIYGNQIDYRRIMPYWYIFDFPQCIMYFLLHELKYTFHFVSVLITTLLCLQKTAALLFPMWSKRHLSNTASILYNDDAVIRNCVVWQAQNGAVFQTGWWTQRHMQHVRVSDIDIIHTDWCTFKGNNCHLSDNNGVLDQTGNTKDFQISDVEFRNIRIEGIVPRIFNFNVHAGAVGHISDFSFVNWTIESQPMGDAIHNVIKGSSSAHVSGSNEYPDNDDVERHISNVFPSVIGGSLGDPEAQNGRFAVFSFAINKGDNRADDIGRSTVVLLVLFIGGSFLNPKADKGRFIKVTFRSNIGGNVAIPEGDTILFSSKGAFLPFFCVSRVNPEADKEWIVFTIAFLVVMGGHCRNSGANPGQVLSPFSLVITGIGET